MREYRLFQSDIGTHDGRVILDPVVDMKVIPLLVRGDGPYEEAEIVDKVVRVSKLPHSNWWTGWTEYEVPEGYFLSPAFIEGEERGVGDLLYIFGSRLRSLVVLPLDKAVWDGYTAPIPTRARFI